MEAMGDTQPKSYDPTRDTVVLAAWAGVPEMHAAAWVHGKAVDPPVLVALERAAKEIRGFVTSPEYQEVLEDITRFRKISPIRRLEIADDNMRFDMRMREAYLRGMGRTSV